MKKLTDSDDFVNTTEQQILNWADEMAKKGLYDLSTSRNLRTALKALLGVLESNERRDPRSLLAQMESIAERWARANRANPTTMKTYRQRASQLLEDYIGFMENPGSFKGRGGGTAPKKTEKKEVRRAAAQPPPAGGGDDSTVRDQLGLNTFRLPNGKIVRYSLPEDFTIEDLRRVVYHLLPTTIDFDPGRPGGGFPPMSPAIDANGIQ
jgi:hypothetical protein